MPNYRTNYDFGCRKKSLNLRCIRRRKCTVKSCFPTLSDNKTVGLLFSYRFVRMLYWEILCQAIRRLSFLEHRFEKDLKLKEAYSEFLREYLQQGHMELVEDQNHISARALISLHQPVVRLDSMTTKLRVVFDASSKTTNDISLNDKLMPGQNLQADLQKILIRFRSLSLPQMWRYFGLFTLTRPGRSLSRC